MKEALDLVKHELGDDAVIIGTRTVERRGVMGLAGKTSVEITATSAPASHVDGACATAVAGASSSRRPGQPPVIPADDRIAAYRQHSACGPGEPSGGPVRQTGPTSDSRRTELAEIDPLEHDDHAPLIAEINAIKAMVSEMLSKGVSPASPAPSQTEGQARAQLPSPSQGEGRVRVDLSDCNAPDCTPQGSDPPPALPQSLLDAYVRLIGEQVAKEWADDLFAGAAADLDAGGSADPEQVRARLSEHLQQMLPTSPGILLNPSLHGRLVAFVGPTGAGKTTTIAKLACHAKRHRKADVVLATTDVDRPGSAERLAAYARMLEVPFEAVRDERDLRVLHRKYARANLIFLDTAGCGVMDKARVERLRSLLIAARPDETYLVVSATTQPAAAREAIRGFRSLGADRVVVSKVDEAVGLGVLLALAQHLEIRLSYLTTGQNVPADIELASAQRVARMILQDRPVTAEVAAC